MGGADRRWRQTMKHFSLEDWADFVNQVALASKRASMEHHLAMGCTQCGRSLARWERMRGFARQENANLPPDNVVRAAKYAFQTYGPRREGGAIRELARLVFDSFREPILVGVRASHMTTRQLLYQADALMIDLRIEGAADPGRMLLAGQVMDSVGSGKGIGEVPILLLYGRETVARTQTNELGEFRLECDAGKSLQISVGVSERKRVFIPLDDAVWRIPTSKRTN